VQRDRNTAGAPPFAIVVMGVSGSGKSTVGAQLAAKCNCSFLEGDSFHTAESVAKMRSGRALDDADRWPWLDRLGATAGMAARSDGLSVTACSALKRIYRQRLVEAARVEMLFVLLDANRDELARRMAQRPGHYMPASLLDSQLAALERPGPDERALMLDSRLSPDRLADAARDWARNTLAATGST